MASASSAHAWQAVAQVGTEDVRATAIAVGPRGDVAVGGITDISGDQGIAAVAMLSRTGRPRWTLRFAEPGSRVVSMHVDRRGDVLVGARVHGDDEDTHGPFTVRKLDGRTGAELWRDGPHGHWEIESRGAVLVDDAGDALVGFVELEWDPFGDYVIHHVLRKLSGADGSERWRLQNGGVPIALRGDSIVVRLSDSRGIAMRSVADGALRWASPLFSTRTVLDRAGDVVNLYEPGGGGVTITKLAAVDGSVRWSRTLEKPELYRQAGLVVDRNGDVVIAGNAWPGVPSLDVDLAVVKLAGADGAELWRVEMDGPADEDDRAFAVVADRRGDLLLAGQTHDPAAHVFVAKLRSRDGAIAWKVRDVSGAPLALAPGGGVVLAGATLLPPEPCPPGLLDAAFVVTKLSGRAGRGLRP